MGFARCAHTRRQPNQTGKHTPRTTRYATDELRFDLTGIVCAPRTGLGVQPTAELPAIPAGIARVGFTYTPRIVGILLRKGFSGPIARTRPNGRSPSPVTPHRWRSVARYGPVRPRRQVWGTSRSACALRSRPASPVNGRQMRH